MIILMEDLWRLLEALRSLAEALFYKSAKFEIMKCF